MNDAVALLEYEVRELARRRGIDPVEDFTAFRSLISEALADYDDRSMAGLVPPLADSDGVAKGLLDAVAGLGPLQRYLDDPTVEELLIYDPGKVFVARSGRP